MSAGMLGVTFQSHAQLILHELGEYWATHYYRCWSG